MGSAAIDGGRGRSWSAFRATGQASEGWSVGRGVGGPGGGSCHGVGLCKHHLVFRRIHDRNPLTETLNNSSGRGVLSQGLVTGQNQGWGLLTDIVLTTDSHGTAPRAKT